MHQIVLAASPRGSHVGATRHFLYCFRDPMGGGALFNTSNALAIPILPGRLPYGEPGTEASRENLRRVRTRVERLTRASSACAAHARNPEPIPRRAPSTRETRSSALGDQRSSRRRYRRTRMDSCIWVGPRSSSRSATGFVALGPVAAGSSVTRLETLATWASSHKDPGSFRGRRRTFRQLDRSLPVLPGISGRGIATRWDLAERSSASRTHSLRPSSHENIDTSHARPRSVSFVDNGADGKAADASPEQPTWLRPAAAAHRIPW